MPEGAGCIYPVTGGGLHDGPTVSDLAMAICPNASRRCIPESGVEMKRVVLMAGWLAALLPIEPPVYAQPRPVSTPVTATAVRDAAGGSIVIRNVSEFTVTAIVYVYTMRNPDAGVVYAANGYYDSAIDPQTQPAIKPGQEVRIPYRIPFSNAIPVIGIDSVLFADGSSYGERTPVQIILDRRNYTLVSLNKSIADLKQAAKDGLSRQELINKFQMSIAMDASNAGDAELANCIQLVRSQVVANLIRNGRLSDGTPIPIAESIQSEIDALNARRETLRAAVGGR
jgi:hypothetical protein